MKNKRGAAETGFIKTLILAIGAASVAHAGSSYLPLTGSPALRVLAVKSPKPVPAMKTETVTKVATTDTNCPPVEIKAFNTNTTETVVNSAGGYGSNLMGTPSVITLSPGNPLDVPGGASAFAFSSQDTLGITPQILATYFQPMILETNGMAVAIPVRVGFIPPFAQLDKSSHAEYIIK